MIAVESVSQIRGGHDTAAKSCLYFAYMVPVGTLVKIIAPRGSCDSKTCYHIKSSHDGRGVGFLALRNPNPPTTPYVILETFFFYFFAGWIVAEPRSTPTKPTIYEIRVNFVLSVGSFVWGGGTPPLKTRYRISTKQMP